MEHHVAAPLDTAAGALTAFVGTCAGTGLGRCLSVCQDTCTFAGENIARAGIDRVLDDLGYDAVRSSTVTTRTGVTAGQKRVRHLTVPRQLLTFEDEVPHAITTFMRAADARQVVNGDFDNPLLREKIELRLAFRLGAGLHLVGREIVRSATDSPPGLADPRDREDLMDNGMCGYAGISLRELFDGTARVVSDTHTAFIDAMLRAAGAGKVFMVDLVYDSVIFTSVSEMLDQMAEGRSTQLASYVLSKAYSIVNKAVREVESNGGGVTQLHRTYAIDATRLVCLALLFDRNTVGCNCLTFLTPHRDFLVSKYFSSGDAAPEKDPIDSAQEALDEIRGGLQQGVIPSIAATDLTGELYDKGVVATVDEDEIWRFVSSDGADGEGNNIGGIETGPNIFGCAPPIDTASPSSYISAFTRHLCKGTGRYTTSLGEEVLQLVDKSLYPEPSDSYKKVTADITRLDQQMFARFVDDENITDAEVSTFKSSQMLAEQADAILADLAPLWCQQMERRDLTTIKAGAISGMADCQFKHAIMVGVFLKAGENSRRARFISQPGSHGTQDVHQACVARSTQLLERFHKKLFNHHNIKGLDMTGLGLSVGEFLENTPDDHHVVSLDKSANDRSWGPWQIEMVCNYTIALAGNIWEAVFIPYPEATTFDMCVKTRYYTVNVDAAYSYLMSAVGTTSLWNRLESDANVGVLALNMYGQVGYEKWLRWRARGVPSTYADLYDGHFCAHMTIPYIKLVGDASIETPIRYNDEGDDLKLTLAPTIIKRGEEVTLSYEAMVDEVVKQGTTMQLKYEPAVPPPGMQTGPNAVAEFTSRYFMRDKTKTSTPEAVMIPKPVKAIQKAWWMQSTQFTYVRHATADHNGNRLIAIRDRKFHALAATKFASIAEQNVSSPVVGEFMLNLAKSHLLGCDINQVILWHERSQEARHTEDAVFPAEKTIGAWIQRIENSKRSRPFTKSELLLASVAWKMENPALASIPCPRLQEHLLTWDAELASTPVDENYWKMTPQEFLSLHSVDFIMPLVRSLHCALYSRISAAKPLAKQHATFTSVKDAFAIGLGVGRKRDPKGTVPCSHTGARSGSIGRKGPRTGLEAVPDNRSVNHEQNVRVLDTLSGPKKMPAVAKVKPAGQASSSSSDRNTGNANEPGHPPQEAQPAARPSAMSEQPKTSGAEQPSIAADKSSGANVSKKDKRRGVDKRAGK